MRTAQATLLALALLSSGCAAVFKGSKQSVHFVADPQGSDLRVDGQYKGATPVDAELDRDRSQNVRVSRAGYTEQQVQIRRRNDTGWFFWDIASCVIPITLCIPVLVDAISGAWYSFDDSYSVKLDPAGPPPTATAWPTTTGIVPASPPREGDPKLGF